MKVKVQSAKGAQNVKLACIILAAGKGTRMKSTLPKVMHKLAGKPMLMHVIDTARAMNAEQTIVVSSTAMQTVRESIGQVYKNSVSSAVQVEQLGTGDAVKATKAHLKDFKGTVLILYGDTPLITIETLTRMTQALKEDAKLAAVVLGMEVPAPNDYGRLVINKKGVLERIAEAKDATAKERSITLCNSGVMAVRGSLLFALLAKLKNKNAKGEYYLTDLVALAAKEGHRAAAVTADASELLGINSRVELATAEACIQKRLRNKAMESGVTLINPETVYFSQDTKFGKDVTIHPHVVFGPGVEIGDNVEIEPFCHIEGAKIESTAAVGPFARLRPGAVICEHASIGNFVEIKKSTIKRGAKVKHLSYIGDTQLGESSNIGAGTIVANYDGYHKFSTVIGSGVSIGSNTVLVAPVMVGDGAIVGAGSVITEDVDSNALAIARAPQKQKPQWAKSFRLRKNN